MTKVLAIIQARLASKRLPRKVLAEIGPWPVIRHVYERVRVALPDVVIAAPENDAAILCQAVIPVQIWGSTQPMNDVLGRFVEVAQEYDPDIIVRITADCPFIQPELIRRVVDLIPPSGFASNVDPDRTFPDGLDVEAFTTEALYAWDDLCSASSHREHVTAFWREDPTRSCGVVSYEENLSHHRWTLDTPADLAWFRRIAEEIDVTPPHPTMDELLQLIRRKPELGHYA